MSTSSTRTSRPQTNLRNVRKLLASYMAAAEQPELCRRIRVERERLRDDWKAEHPGEKGNPYTQEALARRLTLTLKAYRAYEDQREPSRSRAREIARELGLPEDHFDGSDSMVALREEG